MWPRENSAKSRQVPLRYEFLANSLLVAPDAPYLHYVSNETVEGLRHNTLPIMSVQYHPEASPGPTDNLYLFDEFKALMRKG